MTTWSSAFARQAKSDLDARDISERAGRVPSHSHVIRSIRSIADKIERLAPANDAGGTAPSNCEYPWMGPAGKIIVPAENSFELTLLYEKAGVTLLKLLRIAAERLGSSPAHQP